MAVDVKTFATELARSLTSRGIPKDIAIKHAVSLVRTFDEEDLREISSYSAPEEFEELSNSLAELIKDKEMSQKKADGAPRSPDKDTGEEKPSETEKAEKNDTPDASSELDRTVGAPKSFAKMGKAVSDGNDASAATGEFRLPKRKDGVPVSVDTTVEAPRRPVSHVPEQPGNMKTRSFRIESEQADDSTKTFAGIKTGDISLMGDAAKNAHSASIEINPEPVEDNVQEIYLDDDGTLPNEPEKVKLSGRGKAVFWGVSIVSFPIVLVIAVLVLGVFALGILTVCAFILAAILLLCAEAVAGCGCALVGIIYGAIEIVSGNLGIGLYEIGLGIACGGLAMLLSILTYNLAVVAMPYILKQLIAFEGYCLREVGPMLGRFRGECSKL